MNTKKIRIVTVIAIILILFSIPSEIVFALSNRKLLSSKVVETKGEKDAVYCKNSGDMQQIAFKYNESKDMVLEFDLLGINQITQLRRVKERENTEEYPISNFENLKLQFSSDTDWVSPYGLRAKENTFDNKDFSVGGNHKAYSAITIPTARREYAKVYRWLRIKA